MKPQVSTHTRPISIASVNPAVYRGEGGAVVSAAPATDKPSRHLQWARAEMLASVVSRSGEVEAAEWALDQAKAACGEQIIAAVSAGLSPEEVGEACGLCEYEVAEIIAAQAPPVAS